MTAHRFVCSDQVGFFDGIEQNLVFEKAA